MLLQLETLESLIEYNKAFAENWFKEKGFIDPMIIGYTRNNQQRVVIIGRFENDTEKQHWLMTATVVFYLFDIDKYVVMNEGWMVKDPTIDVAEIYKKYGSLEKYPGRAECLSILAVNKHGAKMSTSEILADRTLQNICDGYKVVSGRMCELLPNNFPPLSPKKRNDILNDLKKMGIALEDIKEKL